VEPQHQRDCRHGGQRRQPVPRRRLLNEEDAQPDYGEHHRQIEPVPRGQDERPAGDPSAEFSEGENRARERHGANQDPEVGLDVVDGLRRAGERRAVAEDVGKADEHGRQADEAVQDRDELRHLRHLHPAGEHEADRAAGRQRRQQKPQVGSDHADDRRDERDGHAGNPGGVALPRGVLPAQPAEREYEENGRGDVGNGEETRWHATATS
jgi:hypothetical protein